MEFILVSWQDVPRSQAYLEPIYQADVILDMSMQNSTYVELLVNHDSPHFYLLFSFSVHIHPQQLS
jgi:hypothetical protein